MAVFVILYFAPAAISKAFLNSSNVSCSMLEFLKKRRFNSFNARVTS